MRRIAIVLLGGCSHLFVTAAPDPDCTRSLTAPLIDSAVAINGAMGSLAALLSEKESTQLLGIGLVVATLAYAGSARDGFAAIDACRANPE